MNDILNLSDIKVMNSKEIAELTGKSHKHVLRDIRKLLEDLYGPKMGQCNQGLNIHYSPNGDYKSVDLDKDHTMTLITGYESRLRFTVNKRWRELEEQQNNNILPNFNNPAEAARAWALQYEERVQLENRLEEAKPKLEYMDKYVQSNNSKAIREAAKILGIKERTFTGFLKSKKIVYVQGGALLPYQQYIDKGLRYTIPIMGSIN